VTVAGGNLVLTADGADFGGKSYTSGKVESKWTNQYGRWEVRAKLPGTKGTWPAIWLLPDTNLYPWPSQGEIDIMENRGHEPLLTSSAYHWGPNWWTHQSKSAEQKATNGGIAENYHNEFHTYTVEWSSSLLQFYVDEVLYQTVTDADTGGFLGNQTAPVETVLNVAVGGDFLGGAQPDGSSVWPQQMLVDYVRVYERDASPSPVVLKNGSFEIAGGSLASWATFGNALPNVQTHHEAPAAEGDETLKLFGQFNGVSNSSGVFQGISVSPGDEVRADLSRFIRSADSIVGTGNTALMKIEFLNGFGVPSSAGTLLQQTSLTIADGTSLNDVWEDFNLQAVAPVGAVEARLVITFSQTSYDSGAVHVDDVSFVNLDLEFDADANADGSVNGLDFLAWQQGLGRDDATSVADGDFNYDGLVDHSDLNVWDTQYGGVPVTSSSFSVPEPTCLAFLVVATVVFVSLRSKPGTRFLEVQTS
jgi:beta-glucanase (GH16 family)